MQATDVIKKLDQLVSPPEVCLALNDIADKPETTNADIQAVIERDPALTARILQIANSPLYSITNNIDNVPRAIMVMGTNAVRDLAWASAMVTTFNALDSQLDLKAFWRHSLYTATIARILAHKCQVVHKDRIFTGALLHDIGRLVMFTVLPEEAENIIQRVENNQESLSHAERVILGFDHAELGAALMKEWRLPLAIQMMTQFHHTPVMANQHKIDACIVHIADNAARGAGVFSHKSSGIVKFNQEAWQVTGLNEKIIDAVIGLADEQYTKMVRVFLAASGEVAA